MSMCNLQSFCSRYFTFADLIECGDTWNRLRLTGTPLLNLPLRVETLEGISDLAREILDPLHDEFGAVIITYGFAGPALTRHIKARISPPHDQHAGSEADATGELICKRRGQSCDLHIPGRDALETAQWIRTHLPFDRIYIYGSTSPIHVSYGPQRSGKLYAMLKAKVQRVPRDVTRSNAEELRGLFSKT